MSRFGDDRRSLDSKRPLDRKRRRLVVAALGALACAPSILPQAFAHTPYRQWQVYRRKHLLIGCHRDAPATYALAKRVVAQLEAHLPDARARVARGPTAGRLASLMGSGQLAIAVLGDRTATAMSEGRDVFKPYGPVPIRTLTRLSGSHVLVAHASFPDRHARLVTEALDHLGDAEDEPKSQSEPVGKE